jgi:hypothetical protein
MYIYQIRFKSLKANRGAAILNEPLYDELGYAIDSNNISVAAASWEDAIAYAMSKRNGRDILSITLGRPVDLAPITQVA